MKLLIKTLGFQLIEILITLAIISILASICMPIYTQHLQTMYRMEAATTLSKLALALEHYYIEHNTYANASLSELHFTSTIAHQHYALAIESANDHDYLLTAKPLVSHDQCGTLTLNAGGEKHVTGNAAINECW